MARRNASTESTTDAPEVEATTDETVEAPSTEAVEATAEATEGDAPAEVEAPAEVDFTAFTQAAEAAVAQRDTSSGDLPEGALEPVLEQYKALPDTKARNKAKKTLQESMRASLGEGDMSKAKAFLTLEDNMTTVTPGGSGSERKERTPADPTAQFKHNLLVATLAYQELVRNVPEGVNVDEITGQASATEMIESVDAYRAFLDTEVGEGEEAPEAPEVPAQVIQAFRLVRGNKTRARVASPGSASHDGPRRDIGKHILSAFEGVESGTFLSVAEIRKHTSDEYGDASPSAGAISARLFPKSGKCTLEGIEPGTGGDKGNKGARKV